MRLATFVHISDLHIGDTDLDGDAAMVPKPWKYAPRALKEKFFGHETPALYRLEEKLEEMPEEDRPFLVIVSGDLTSFGKRSHFETFDDYAAGNLVIGEGDPFGPDLNSSCKIPGNHDHWPGTADILGLESAAFRERFPQDSLPCQQTLVGLEGGQRVRIIRIDTDDGVNPHGWTRFCARGSFVHQLNELTQEVSEPDPNEIRVLLLHHSPANTNYILGIEDQSRAVLERFLGERDIAVMLTGHMHTPEIERHSVKRGSTRYEVLEVRCGTTTQLVNPTVKQRKRLELDVAGAQAPQTLFLHRLDRKENGAIEWSAEAHVSTHLRGFHYGPVYPTGRYYSDSLQVWPRP